MTFEFAAPGRIVFGPGRVEAAGGIARSLARPGGSGRVLLVTGADEGRSAPVADSLERSGLDSVRYSVRGEPRFDDARAATALARSEGCDVVVGCGGGSALDLAKAVAALLANPGDPMQYAEVIGGGAALSEPSYPCLAIPTTSGTGSEATRNAVLASPERRVKVSLRSPTMLPSVALVDPELTHGLPPEITAQTGMDALAQLLEPFVCSCPSPLTDSICRGALPLVARSLVAAFENGADAAAREEMAYASLSGGLALGNARLGAVHGIAGPLGGAFPVPHGAACGALLAPVVAANIRALRSRDPEGRAMERYAEAASLLGGGLGAEPEDLPRLLADLAARLGIKRLGSYGISEKDFPELAGKAAVSSSMRGNPVALTNDELIFILNEATV